MWDKKEIALIFKALQKAASRRLDGCRHQLLMATAVTRINSHEVAFMGVDGFEHSYVLKTATFLEEFSRREIGSLVKETLYESLEGLPSGELEQLLKTAALFGEEIPHRGEVISMMIYFIKLRAHECAE